MASLIATFELQDLEHDARKARTNSGYGIYLQYIVWEGSKVLRPINQKYISQFILFPAQGIFLDLYKFLSYTRSSMKMKHFFVIRMKQFQGNFYFIHINVAFEGTLHLRKMLSDALSVLS